MRLTVFGLIVAIAAPSATNADVLARAQRVWGVRILQYDWLSTDRQHRLDRSLWGAVQVNYADTELGIRYLNVVVATGPPPAPPAWVVQNLAIAPHLGRRRQQDLVFFDLAELGLTEGEALQNACWVVALSFDDQPAPPQAPPKCGEARRETYTLGHERPGVQAQKPQPKAPNPPKHPFEGKGELLGPNRPRVPYNGIDENPNQCMPGSMARSLDWLNRAYKLGKKLSVFALYRGLIKKGVGTGSTPLTPAAFEGSRIGKKKDYTDDTFGPGRIITKTWDSGGKVDTPAGMSESGEAFETWLRREWETEAVEIAYEEPGGAHIVTLTELWADPDGGFSLRYRDDSAQDDSNGGDKAQKRARIVKNAQGDWEFSKGSRKIHYAVSESVVPPPAPPPARAGMSGAEAEKGALR